MGDLTRYGTGYPHERSFSLNSVSIFSYGSYLGEV